MLRLNMFHYVVYVAERTDRSSDGFNQFVTACSVHLAQNAYRGVSLSHSSDPTLLARMNYAALSIWFWDGLVEGNDKI